MHLPLIAGLLAAALPLVAGLLPGDAPDQLERLTWATAAAGLPWLVVARTWRRWPEGRRGFVMLLAATAVAHLALLLLPPLTSEDVYRYVWDGVVQWQGLSPYQFAPDHSALNTLVPQDPDLAAIRSQIGHAHIPTIYPPVAQIAFFGAAGLAPSTTLMRGVMTLADVITVAALWGWLLRLNADPRRALLYAFCPLALIETSVGGHVDAIGVTGLALAGAWLGPKPWRAGAALALGIGTKILPVILLPWLVLRRHLKVAIAAVAVSVATALPYLEAGDRLMGGLAAYGHRWRGNDGAFSGLMWLISQPITAQAPPDGAPFELPLWMARVVRLLVGGVHDGPPEHVWPDELAFALTKGLAAGLIGLWLLGLLWKARTFEGFAIGAMGAVMLLSPVVHPWYLLWLLPLATVALGRSAHRSDLAPLWPWAFWIWALTAWIAYLPRPTWMRTGEWSTSAIWLAVEHVPVWMGLAVAAWRGVKHRAG